MFRHIVAALVAFAWCLRHQLTLGIKTNEYKRYWAKAINLALCYQGFASNSKMSSSIGAGKAAFFCCAYDVITDWRDFNPQLFGCFESLVRRSLNTAEADMAINLYQQEKSGQLEESGLSRGFVALKFVTKIMGSESFIQQRTDFHHFGIVMQIADDVLDYEEDQREHKTNSLLSEKRNDYLLMLVDFPVEKTKAILPHGFVLWKVVAAAQNKAKHMLSSSNRLRNFGPTVDVNNSPYHNVDQKDCDKVLCNICK